MQTDQHITRYGPQSQSNRLLGLIRDAFADLRAAQGLAIQLAARDFKVQYRQTAIGILWAFLLPATYTFIWLFMQRGGLVEIPHTGLPYAAFVLSGTILWSIFSDAVHAPLKNVQAAKDMLTKIKFPREALILAGIYHTLLHAGVRLLVLLIALMLMDLPPQWQALLSPLGLLTIVLLGTCVGVILTPIGMLYKDVAQALPTILQLLMFLSPVVYALPKTGELAKWLEWNPLMPLIVMTRNMLTGQALEHWPSFALVLIMTLIALLFGWLLFRAAMPVLIERMSA